jgi:hypothetical protein
MPKEVILRDPVDVARLNALVNRLAMVAEDDLQIAECAARAKSLASVEEGVGLLQLSDQELAEKGWLRAELIIATDAKRCKKEVPYYVTMAHERVIGRQRLMQSATNPSAKARMVLIPVTAEDDER